jgi:hypothetical protein
MPDTQLTQSPRAQGFQVQQGPQDEDELFQQGFSDLAYRALNKSNPELVAEVLTFRILDAKADKGSGVGAFIVLHGQEVFLIPCVVASNEVKPLDMFYSRRMDRYYPLRVEWLDEASKGGETTLGIGVEPPKTLPTDVDIRNLVVPPTTGRYSYAAAADDPGWVAFAAARQENHEDRELLLPTFLASAPEAVKIAAERVIGRNHRLLKAAAEFYGLSALRQAWATSTKTATHLPVEVPLKHDVYMVSASTPIQEMKAQLGDETAEAFKAVRLRGFYIKDKRPTAKSALEFSERSLDLATPDRTGVYKVYLTDGAIELALVVCKPITTATKGTGQARDNGAYHRVPEGACQDRFLVLLRDGRMIRTNKLVAEPVTAVTFEDVQDFVKDMTTEGPKAGERGVFVCAAGLTVKATEPVRVQRTTSKNGQTSHDIVGWDISKVVVLDKLRGAAALKSPEQSVLTLGGDYRWFKAKGDGYDSSSDLYSDPTSILRAFEQALLRNGAEAIEVRKGSGGFKVAGLRELLPKTAALVEVMRRYELRESDAEAVLERAAAGEHRGLWALKVAAGESLGDPNDPNNQPVTDPAAQQAGGPSSVDLAVAEQMQILQGQLASVQQQMQILQQVAQRAQQIEGGGGGMAAPMGMAAMQGGPAQGNMQPVPAGGAPPPGGAPPGGAPAPGGAPPPGGDPAAAGGAPPPGGAPGGAAGVMNAGGMAPQAPPPPPVMTEDPTPENVQSQMNPAFLDQAAGLQQADVFDAAAIASLSQQKGMREKIQAYLPTLDHALDNIGRILLLFRLKEDEVREQVGNDQQIETEQKLRDVFQGLGDALLRITQSSDQLGVSSRT